MGKVTKADIFIDPNIGVEPVKLKMDDELKKLIADTRIKQEKILALKRIPIKNVVITI